MKGYIVYATYNIVEDKPIISLFGRLINGETFHAKTGIKPYFYVKEKDVKRITKQFKIKPEKTELKDFNGNKISKVTVDQPKEVPQLKKMLEDEGYATYEADIRFVQRYYIDKGILGTIELKGDYKSGERVDRVYENPEIKAVEPYDVKLKVLSFDIETDPDAKAVYSIALACGEDKEVHILTNKKVRGAISYDSEGSLLKGFIDSVTNIDPDIIVGWNVIDFDFSVLHSRAKALNIPFTLGRTEKEVFVRKQRDFFRDSIANVPGRIVFDGISLLKQAFLSFDNYKLDTVAKAVLSDKKVELEEGFWDNFTEIIKTNPMKVVKYNIKDAELVLDILKKKKLIDLMIKKSLITGLQLDRVRGSVAALDSLYIRKAKARGFVCPNSAFRERKERIKGAYVMNPKPGVYDYIAVLDFKSLYPSIIRTFNIDPIAHRKEGTIVAPNKARFVNNEGILPEIILDSWKERDTAKREKDDVKSYAIKIIMNSFYGVLANPSCRFYSLEMGNAITGFAREIIRETAEIIEKEGYNVIYGDTDSVFVDLKVKSENEAKQIGKKIADRINEHYRKSIRERYDRLSYLELELDKVFKVLILPKIRGSEGGAKKRYAGIEVKNRKESISITGMEFVRSDWTAIAKEFQIELLNRVFHKKDVTSYVKKIINDIKSGKHDDKLIYRKALRKELDDYTKITPPHVKAARLLPKIKSKSIEYYMTDNGPEPVEMLTSPIDYDHYIEKQIKPIAESILNLFGTTFDEVSSKTKQKSIFEY